ncbi:unnamed protein product [Polarella glacialis]|uniref:Uncharacterized protein n=1 Tax=Polarella glacialis TaxID=89957 RepID=A0A813DXR6_POLGL|nr:unnamed protein product [Polarella glacialis]|mmetsp:Transcript_87781/g.158210  ORF Transcript_87781/g.158210 Transcript_87781/m.158210 type:complete len:151 (+) Transcript_87781:66-518(+)
MGNSGCCIAYEPIDVNEFPGDAEYGAPKGTPPPAVKLKEDQKVPLAVGLQDSKGPLAAGLQGSGDAPPLRRPSLRKPSKETPLSFQDGAPLAPLTRTLSEEGKRVRFDAEDEVAPPPLKKAERSQERKGTGFVSPETLKALMEEDDDEED